LATVTVQSGGKHDQIGKKSRPADERTALIEQRKERKRAKKLRQKE
jgi:hypothetical protein